MMVESAMRQVGFQKAPLVLAVALVLSGAGRGQAASPPRPVRPRKAYTLSGGPWRVGGSFDTAVHLRNESGRAAIKVTPVVYMEDGTAVQLAPVEMPPSTNADLDLASSLSLLPPGEVTLWGSMVLTYTGNYAGELFASMDIQSNGSSGLSTDFQYDAGSFLPSPSHPLDPGPNASVLEQRLARAANKHLAGKASAVAVKPEGQKPLEGVWSKPSALGMGWLALSNMGASYAVVDWAVFGSAGDRRSGPELSIPPHGTEMVSLEPLIAELPSAEQGSGGLEIDPRAAQGQVRAEAAFYDAGSGAILPVNLQMKGWGLGQPVNARFAIAGLPVGTQPARYGFPVTADFEPSVSLRNVTKAPLPVEMHLSLSPDSAEPATPCTLRVPVTLAAENERDLPLGPTLRAAGCPRAGVLNIMLRFRGRRGDLEVAARSTGGVGGYEVEGTVHDMEQMVSFGESMIYWTNAGGATTLLTIWNPVQREQRLRLGFSGGSGVSLVTTNTGAVCRGCYYVSLDLPPGASVTLSTAALRTAAPDRQGNLFPAATEGSLGLVPADKPLPDVRGIVHLPKGGLPPMWAVMGETVVSPSSVGIASLTGAPQRLGGAHSERGGTCQGAVGAEGGDPCGYFTTYIDGQIYMSPGTSENLDLEGEEGSDNPPGPVDNVTNKVTTWSSSNTSVATVDAYGKVTAVAVGSTEIRAEWDDAPVWNGCHCPAGELVGEQYIFVTQCGDPVGYSTPDTWGQTGWPSDRGPLMAEYGATGPYSPGVQDDSSCSPTDGACIASSPTFTPACSDFTESASNAYYSFNTLKGSDDYQWALIQYPLVEPASTGVGLSAWVSSYETAYGAGVPTFNSGYRTPVYNLTLNGSARASRHMFGDAADLNSSGSETIFLELTASAYAAGASYVEPNNSYVNYGHVHADWRNRDVGGSFQP